jgi:hypothetical protein
MVAKLPDKQRLERHKARGKAINYATLALRKKYNDEWKALYVDYLIDNGIYDNQETERKANDRIEISGK